MYVCKVLLPEQNSQNIPGKFCRERVGKGEGGVSRMQLNINYKLTQSEARNTLKLGNTNTCISYVYTFPRDRKLEEGRVE